MKKEYQKPDILCDIFSLSSTIAGSCSFDTNTMSQGNCGVQFGELKVFTSQVQGCKGGVIVDSGQFNGLCYHVPTNDKNIFMS